MSSADDADDFDLPEVDRDAVSTGAAADSSDRDERLDGLPRLLRYAMLVTDDADHIEQRLIAEIDELCPQSGRIEARTGLRMMPTFPRSPLSFRTAGFPRYGWKAGISGGAFLDGPVA
jgi:hypothetical protein